MFPSSKHNSLAMRINRITLMTALGAAAFGAGFLPQSARAQLVVDYTFNSTANVPDNGQITDIQTLGGLAAFSNVKMNLALTSTSGSTMWLGDLYSTLTFGTASEASRTSVLLNRPGRSNTSIAGSGLSSLNVTLDDTAATNIFGTTSSTGTYQSDGRIGVNPAGPRVAFNPADRTATLAALNHRQRIVFRPIEYGARGKVSGSKFHPIWDTLRLWRVVWRCWRRNERR